MKSIFSLSFVLIFCAITNVLPAQKNYLLQHYSVKDGLPNNTVYSINQDRNSYLWIATDGGISRFDGSHFDNTVLPEVNQEQAYSQYIEKTPDGKLAFATFMQGTIIEQDNGTFRQYLRRKKQIGKNVVRTLKALPDGRVLTSESNSINIVENDTIRQIYYCGENRVMFQTLEYDHNGNIWFGGIDGLGLFFDNGNDKKPFMLPEFKNIFIVKILFLTKSKLLIGTKSGYFEVEIQSGTKQLFTYTVSQPLPELKNIPINHIYLDKIGDIWISSVLNGIYHIRNHKIIQRLTMQNGLLTAGAMCVFQDNEGNYWIGTTSGLSKLETFSSYSYHFKDQPLTDISIFGKDKYNRLWIAYKEQILWVNGDSILEKNTNEIPFLRNREIKNIDFCGDKVYFFLDNGIFTLPLTKQINWNSMSAVVDFKKWGFDRLHSYLFDGNVLWLGSDYGLFYLLDGKLKKCSFGPDKEMENLNPNMIVKDKFDNYWIGDKMYGLYRFQVNNNLQNKNGILAPTGLKTYKSLKSDSAFVTAWTQALTLDSKGYLWLSTLYTGVYKLTIGADGVESFQLYTNTYGLSSNDVTQISEGKDHSMWFATRNGADRLISDNAGKENWEHYNDKNGFGRMAYAIFNDDSITYICYEEGFYAIDNRIRSDQSKKYKTLISEILVMNKPDIAALANAKKRLILPHNRNYISFKFEAVTFNHNSEIEYQYYLQGLEKQWNDYAERRFVEYSALPPGNYTFHVRCRRIGSNIVSDISSYRFTISPPFYYTWWFISLMALLVVGTLFLFYRNRIKQLIQMERMRSRIASDLHDDIGSTLSSISIMSNVLQAQIDNSSHSGEIIQKIDKNAHSMLESMDDIIWSVNPANDKFENMSLRIREYAIPLFETSSIDFRIVTPDEMKTISLSMDVRRNIFLICKEAVNNLVKYSGCTVATIDFKLSHSFLTMSVNDNGKGFDTEKQTNRNGLKNMERRAEQIGGKISIKSEWNKGTTITLSVSLA